MTSKFETTESIDTSLEADEELKSEFGAPGLSWSGDGSLAAERVRKVFPVDAELEIFPPSLVDGEAGYPLATFGRRWIGFMIDRLLIAFSAGLVVLLADIFESGAAAAIALIVSLVELGYGAIFNPRGWSPGKLVVGVRIVNSEGGPPGLRKGIFRTAGSVFSQAILWAGYLWSLFDKRNQTWHDKFSKTYVVHATGMFVEDGPDLESQS